MESDTSQMVNPIFDSRCLQQKANFIIIYETNIALRKHVNVNI